MAIKPAKPQPGYALKYRLTGATIIVTGIVVIIPFLLSVPDNAPAPLPVAQVQPQQSVVSAPLSTVGQSDGDSRRRNAQPQAKEPAGEQQAVVTTTADPAQPTGPAWFVRVGTYVNNKNVDAISKLLADNGLEARHTEVQTANAKAVRVWLGPYYDQEEAEQVRLRAKALTHEKVLVTERNPDLSGLTRP